MKLITKIVGATLGLAMAIGVGVGVAANNRTAMELDASSAWTAHTGAITAGNEYLIVRVDGNYSMNPKNSTASGNATANAGQYSQTSFTAASGPDRGFIFADAGNGKFYIKDGTCFVCANGTTNNGLASATSNDTNSNYGIWTVTETATSGQYTIVNANSRQISAYQDSNWRSYSNTSDSRTNVKLYEKAQSSFGTLHHIKVSTPASKVLFEVGETFSSDGLVLTGYDGENEGTANTQTYSSGFTTDYDNHGAFVEGDIGEQTVTVTYSGKTTTYTINVEAAADYIIDGDTNAISGLDTDTSTTDTGTGLLGGIEYAYYALAINEYQDQRNIEFNKAVQDAYLGNNESYGKYIRKIRVTLQYENNFSKLKMYKGDTAIPGTTEVESSGSGVAHVYDFNDDSEYFALKQTTTGSWVVIKKIEVYLGTEIPVVDSVTASIKSGTYYAGTTLSASNFDVTVSWTAGKADTHPTSGFTWTVNGVANGVLEEKNNNKVVVTYEGVSSAEFDVVGSPAAAKDVIASLSTSSSLTYHYSKIDNTADNVLDRAFTGKTGTSYGSDWNNDSTYGISYCGNSAGGNDAIQLRKDNNSGIVVTANTNSRKAKNVSVVWNSNTANGRSIEVYGKDSAYDGPADLFGNSKGTLIGSIVYGTSTSLTINDDYEFIGFKAIGGALYLDSITVSWSDTVTYSYSNVAVKFGGQISSSLWNRLDSESHGILGYGVMVATAEYLSELSIKNYYDLARDEVADVDSVFDEVADKDYTLVDGLNIKCFYNEVSKMPRLIDGNYVWDLVKGVNGTNVGLAKPLTSVAFIRTTDDEIIFLQETTKSAAQVAKDIMDADPNDEYDEDYLEGSLANLASKAN